MPNIIFLNGPSSAGKTTVAKRLQDVFSEPYLHIGIDQLIDCMPVKINSWEEEREACQGFSRVLETDQEGQLISHIKMGPFARKISKTLQDMARLFASQNYNLIIDEIAFGATEVEEWKRTLKNYTVLYVGVRAPLDVLEKRERNREGRVIGSARGQYRKVHESISYDVEIDTHTHTIEENVHLIQLGLEKKIASKSLPE